MASAGEWAPSTRTTGFGTWCSSDSGIGVLHGNGLGVQERAEERGAVLDRRLGGLGLRELHGGRARQHLELAGKRRLVGPAGVSHGPPWPAGTAPGPRTPPKGAGRFRRRRGSGARAGGDRWPVADVLGAGS